MRISTTRAKGIELNVSGYITLKPVRMPVLMQQLERVVAQCRQERNAQLLQQQLAQQLEQSLPLLRAALQRLIQGYYDEGGGDPRPPQDPEGACRSRWTTAR